MKIKLTRSLPCPECKKVTEHLICYLVDVGINQVNYKCIGCIPEEKRNQVELKLFQIHEILFPNL